LQPADVQQRVRPILTGLKFPNLFTLAHRRLGDAQIARLKRALHEFPLVPEGKAFFDRTGYGGYEDISPNELAVLAPYASMLGNP
jgi:phosphonate transport system substrate-binding protein